MMQPGRLYGCPVEFALDVLGGKWKTVILALIKERPMRYSELRALTPSLSDKVLTQRLAGLVEVGLVARESTPDGKGRYVLTQLGHSMTRVLTVLYQWGEDHGRQMGVRFRSDVEP
jgi:DNA-binding HxlR family transcriptional regulator